MYAELLFSLTAVMAGWGHFPGTYQLGYIYRSGRARVLFQSKVVSRLGALSAPTQ